jgi:hypothetical protein
MSENMVHVHRALVTLSIEQNLLSIGRPVYDQVVERLERKYHCYLPNCYDHPEYLRDVLYDLFGDSGRLMAQSITKQVDEFKETKKTKNFIYVMSH